MKLPRSSYNWITVIGASVAAFTLVLILLLFIYSAVFDKGESYLGIFIYMVLPALLILGLLLIPIGMLFARRRDKKKGIVDKRELPVIDLNDLRYRNAFFIFIFATIILLFLSGVGSYEAFHYTESVEFCGTLCHEVMEPEYVAYQNSSHANVKCVECHVGSGADWYVRSKISGLYQVIAVLRNSFPRPIPTPLHDLRPARETCEKCHWPQKFYARSLRVQKNFIADSANSEWDITMQMKTGPVYSALGLQEGIHWHINPNVKIEYVSSDNTREFIPWVKYTNLETGETYIYNDEENPLDEKAMDTLENRVMDCIDCHNRPSHGYLSPPDFVDNALISGRISKEIPYIKKVSMEVLAEEYTDKDTALMTIENKITEYYKKEFPGYYKTNKKTIDAAIVAIQDDFSKNIFPNMKVRNLVYPNHIGHLETDGCFRCHSDRHKTKKGRTITKDCELCHTIVAQGKPGEMASAPIYDTLEFKHPVDISEFWKEMNCAGCHVEIVMDF